MQRKLYRDLGLLGAIAAGLGGLAVASVPAPAKACGGLFCNSNRAVAVNQAAEQIIFSKNADSTVTAVIQIMYEGAATKFAWVLPVPGVPKVAVSSDAAFAALKQATNPLYQLQTTFASGCAVPLGAPTMAGTFSNAGAGGDAGAKSAVTVEASGAIGPYDYDVISVDPNQSDKAQVAVDWLAAHQYDVGPMGADMLRPYLMDGLNLIAFKLTKGSNTGSIRPVMLTYASTLPSIPIRPTAVAANDDMGVLVWVLSSTRAIPENYKALELNDALIDWFMPNNNYNKVVSKAADEAMGQGFVTEYAQKTSAGAINIFPSFQQQQWDQFQAATHPDAMSMIRDATNSWGTWDGFDDALTAAVTLPSTIAFADFKACLACYITAPGVSFDTALFLRKLYEMVIKPMADTQALVDSRPYMTRLYTTMSAMEMTLDPAFDFNPDLADVSNLHTATRVVECSGSAGFNNGPWHVDFPQGTVRGTMTGVWPVKIDDQPAALKILQYGKTGPAKVIDDRTAKIAAMLKNMGSSTGGSGGQTGTAGSASGSGGSMSGAAGKAGGAGQSGGKAGSGSSSTPSSGDGGVASSTVKHSSGCAVADGNASNGLSLLLFSLTALLVRRRRD